MVVRWMLPVTGRQCELEEGAREATLTPAADLLDDGDSYHVMVELPGVPKENVSLTLEKDSLVVSAPRPSRPEGMQVLHDGRRNAWVFERRFALGDGVDRDRVQARLEHGLLHITLPRRAEEKRRRIEVEPAGNAV